MIAGNEFRRPAARWSDGRRGIAPGLMTSDSKWMRRNRSATRAPVSRRPSSAATGPRLLHHPIGDIEYDTFVRFRVGELVVHGWDLAVAAGLNPTLDPDTVEDLWRRVEPYQDQMRAMGSYGA